MGGRDSTCTALRIHPVVFRWRMAAAWPGKLRKPGPSCRLYMEYRAVLYSGIVVRTTVHWGFFFAASLFYQYKCGISLIGCVFLYYAANNAGLHHTCRIILPLILTAAFLGCRKDKMDGSLASLSRRGQPCASEQAASVLPQMIRENLGLRRACFSAFL